MLCSLGFDPDKNAYHTIASYLKELDTPDVLPLQLARQCAGMIVRNLCWLPFCKTMQFFISLASLLTTNRNSTENRNI